jgi:hypothetical protein
MPGQRAAAPAFCLNRGFFELANQMEDCRESASANLEAALQTRHAKPHDRPGARGDLPAERMRLADDVCMSGTDLRRFNCTHGGPTKLMPSRLEQLGIDPA